MPKAGSRTQHPDALFLRNQNVTVISEEPHLVRFHGKTGKVMKSDKIVGSVMYRVRMSNTDNLYGDYHEFFETELKAVK